MRTGRTFSVVGLVLAFVFPAGALAQGVLTVDRAVQLALERNSQVVGANADVLTARSGVYGSYSTVLPRFSAGFSRAGTWTNHTAGNQAFGGFVTPTTNTYSIESYSSSPDVSATWNLLNLSSLTGLKAARSGLRAAELARTATRQDVAFTARQQFYGVVQAIQQERVNTDALRLSRDNERRVRALFEVGSVSKSDVLKAQVLTAQSELDSLTAAEAVVNQRVALAALLGLKESELGEVDTVLTATAQEYDEAALLAEATRNRPDLHAAQAELVSARANLSSANFARLPYITAGGTLQLKPLQTSTFESPPRDPVTGAEIAGPRSSTGTRRTTDRSVNLSVALNWDFFDAFGTESRIAAARARLLRAQDAQNVLTRNLASQVHQALLTYREAIERDRVARRALESAEEDVKLTQQKYNVGSATILELIDAQVQLQRARSQEVAALAAIRVAEAALERVRGRGE